MVHESQGNPVVCESELIRLLLESAQGLAIFVLDLEGRVQKWGPGAERLLGYCPDEIVGRPVHVLFSTDERSDGALLSSRNGWSETDGGDEERWYARKDGTRCYASVRVTPMRHAQGHILGFANILRDRTEWKVREDHLNERAQLAAFSRDVGISLTRATSVSDMLRDCAEAMVRRLDGAFARIWTLNTAGDVLELRASAGMYTHLDGPHSRVPVGQFKIGLIAQERRPHLTNAVQGDPRVGDQEWARREGMVAFAGYPLIVDDRVVGVMAMFARHPLTEVTLEAMASVANGIAIGIERKAAEQELRQQQEWLRVTLASIGDGVIATDTRGHVVFLNGVAQGLTGWSHEGAHGQPLETVFNILHEHTRLPVESPVAKVLREGRVVGLGNHTILVARDGQVRPIDDSAAPIRDTNGDLLGVVLVFRDVTEQRKADEELKASEARKSAILSNALDCVITMDHRGKVVEFNPAAERTFGYACADVVGRELADLIIPPSLRDLHHKGMAHFLATGEGPVLGKRLELPAIRSDGTELPVELAITTIPGDGHPLFTAYLRDISARTRAERLRNARLAATQVLTQAASVGEALSGVLRGVCESLGWDVGLLWNVTDDGQALAYRESWHRPDGLGGSFVARSQSQTFRRNEGLPGRVWSSGQAGWVLDVVRDVNFPRACSAAEAGLHSAFACPIVVGDLTLGVVEFYSKKLLEPDPDLLEMMATICGHVGQFIERRMAEEKLRRSERDLADFFENATIGLHWVGPDGIILRANRAELEMLGYSASEYIGHHIREFHADQPVIDEILRRLEAGENLDDFPARMVCKDGSIRDVLIHSSVFVEDGQFAHTRCFTRDITDRKRAEEALRESEGRFRALMEQAPFSVQIFTPDGWPIRANRAWEELWGITLDRIPWYNILEDQQLEAKGVLPYIRRAFAGEAVTVPAICYDPRETDLDYVGHDDPARWVTAVFYPLKDQAGRVLEVVQVCEDITARRRAEAALQESEEKLRLLVDTIPQLAWMARPDGHILWYNRRWFEYTGTTAEQMEGWGWQSVHDPDILPEVLVRWKASLSTGGPFDMVFPLRGADGVLRPFLTRVMPLRDEEGRVLYWFGTNTDITELKEAREALATSEERLRLALEAGRMGVWDWNIRTNEIKWSDSLEPLHGLEPGTFGGTLTDFQQLIHPDDREMVNAAIQKAVSQCDGYDIEFRNVWPNGSIHWIAGKGKVFAGSDGQPGRMIGIGMDVTRQKRSEQTARFLADASATLAALVDYESTLQRVASLAVPYFADWATVELLGEDGSLRRVGVAHVDPAKVELAHDINRRFPPDPTAPRGVWNILRTGQSEIVPVITDELLQQSIANDELLGMMRDLGLKSYICVPLKVRGKTLGVLTFIVAESGHIYDEVDLAVAQDLAGRAAIAIENAQLYSELRNGDRRKDEFLATLAHELRNPLAPIRNGLQVLRLAGVDGAPVAAARAMMERQVTQMVRLVDDLLDVSRITRNKLDLRKERVELAAVVQSAVETSRPLIDQSRHTLTVKLPPGPVALDADALRLAQVFSNLLNNSAKYTSPGGRISLVADQTGPEVVVRVRDNGMGIPPESLLHIFEMFTQVDRNLERAQGGLGIGLTLVRRLVEMHGGTVEARSDGPGRGSEFIVRLPVSGGAQTHPMQDSSNSAPGNATPHRILVVDDNQDSALSLSMMLKLMGHETRTAFDGLAAIEEADAFRPNLILLDIGLPRLNGYEACQRIRELPWSRGMVIVALTGWGQDEDRRRSIEAGFNTHMVKPVDVSDLEKLLAELTPIRGASK